MQIRVTLTDKEKACIAWLSNRSWVYYYVWGPENDKANGENFTFRSFYKQELSTFWGVGAFDRNEMTGKAEVNELWLEIFRNALKNEM